MYTADGCYYQATDYKVSGYNCYQLGYQSVTVSYGGYSETFTVCVREADKPEIPPTVSVSSERCKSGNLVDVVISISDNTGFANLGLEITYDSALRLVKTTPNTAVGAVFTPAQSLDVYPYNIGFNSVSNTCYNGDLVTLTFEVPTYLQPGDYFVNVDFYKGRDGNYIDGISVNYDENYDPLFLNYQGGRVTVYNYIPGDINGDGTVTNKDGTCLLRYLADWDVDEIDYNTLDTDGNGIIDNKDGTRLLQYLANWNVQVH